MTDNMTIRITFSSSKYEDWRKGCAILSMLGLIREGLQLKTFYFDIEEWMMEDIKFELLHRGIQFDIEEHEEL